MSTQNAWNAENPVQVERGGTGVTLFNSNEILASGTSGNNSLQSIENGNDGEVLVSNGSGSLPSFQPKDSPGSFILLDTRKLSNSSQVVFNNNFINSTYKNYLLIYDGLVPNTLSAYLSMEISDNNGSSYKTSNYHSTARVLSVTDVITETVDTSFRITPNAAANLIGGIFSEGFSGRNFLLNFTIGSSPRIFADGWYARNSDNLGVQCFSGGTYPAGLNVNAIRLFLNVGNIITGEISLYGVIN